MSDLAAQIDWALRYIKDRYGTSDLCDQNPAYRHGGPDAGWYRRTMDGWRRISDTEAATERYEDMRHFMHDPREDDGHGAGDDRAQGDGLGIRPAE